MMMMMMTRCNCNCGGVGIGRRVAAEVIVEISNREIE